MRKGSPESSLSVEVRLSRRTVSRSASARAYVPRFPKVCAQKPPPVAIFGPEVAFIHCSSSAGRHEFESVLLFD